MIEKSLDYHLQAKSFHFKTFHVPAGLDINLFSRLLDKLFKLPEGLDINFFSRLLDKSFQLPEDQDISFYSRLLDVSDKLNFIMTLTRL